MKTTRRAYALLEMLAIIAAVGLMLALSVEPMRTVLSEIPRQSRDFEAWAQTMDMLNSFKADIEQSRHLRVLEQDPQISGDILYLERPDGIVSYSLENNQVFRQSALQNDPLGNSSSWTLPHVQIDWKLWDQNNIPYAIQITTWNERVVLGKTSKNFIQSHVYFLDKSK